MRQYLSLVPLIICLIIFFGCKANETSTLIYNKVGDGTREVGEISQDIPISHAERANSIKAEGGYAQIISTISGGYGAYKDARDAFERYALDMSNYYGPVALNIRLVSVFEGEIYFYLLPLDFIGLSIESLGYFDESMEATWIKMAFAGDGEMVISSDGSYLLTGTSAEGKSMALQIEYRPEEDELRLEVQEDGKLILLFEYIKNKEGYAAQYYFKAAIGYYEGAPKAMCVYKTIFDGLNGSCARFDGVESKPQSLFGRAPLDKEFLIGATHWFTLANGKFTGLLNGKVL